MTTRENSEVTIGFLGAGQMGTPMASRLISSGFNVRVWNRSKDRLKGLIQIGGVAVSTPAEAVTGADVLITMLPDGATTASVMSGVDGAFAKLSSGALWLQMGTVGIDWTEKFRTESIDHDVRLVDAPVSGSVQPATAGQLLILASGPVDIHVLAEQVFEVLGRETFWLGEAGHGSRAKLVLNNWLVDLVEMVAETLKVSSALGLDPHDVVDILAEAPIGSPYAVAKARSMLEGDFSSSFALKHAFKDASLALDAAHSVDEELILTASLIPTWERAMADGAGDSDVSVIYRYAGI